MKLLNWLSSILQVAFIVILVALAALSFGTRLPFFSRMGFNFFAVTSGSMEPTLPVGSLIYAGKYKLDSLKKEDIITFKVKDPQSGAVSIVTHRIEDVLKEEKTETLTDDEGKEKEKKIVKYEFVTKGDANNAIDAFTVPSGNIIGLYQWHIPYIGFVTAFAQTGKGFLLTVILPAVVLIVWEIVSLAGHLKEHYKKKAEREIEKMKEEMRKEMVEEKKKGQGRKRIKKKQH